LGERTGEHSNFRFVILDGAPWQEFPDGGTALIGRIHVSGVDAETCRSP
jgi:hypothetical protein